MNEHKITRRTLLTQTAAFALAGKALAADPNAKPGTPAQPAPQARDILNVALAQIIPVKDDQQKNLEIASSFCRQASTAGADIVLFPEMCNIGYSSFDQKNPDAQAQWQARAIDIDSPFIHHFTTLAAELNMAIAITYLQKWSSAPRDAVSLIDRRGQIVLTYAKVHTCDFVCAEASTTPGDDFPVCDLDTKPGPVKIGCMICYDREFPESARILMLNGAELILTPNACTLNDLQIDQFKTRAYENACAVAMANYAAPACNGRSCAYDANGKPVLEPAAPDEKLCIAQFDLNRIREYRKTTIWGNAFRRPQKYQKLVSTEVTDPFQRTNCFGQPFDRTKR